MMDINQDLYILESKLKFPDKFKKSILNAVRYILSNYYEEVDKIVLFGSCARNTYKITSDVDIMILSKEPLDRYVVSDIRFELLDHPEYVSCDVTFYTYDQFRNSKLLIAKKIKEEGFILWKKEEILITA